MRDQNEFMRQMLDLVEFAKTNENRITKEQVDDFCQDMKLQKSQLKLVYSGRTSYRGGRRHGERSISHKRGQRSLDEYRGFPVYYSIPP